MLKKIIISLAIRVGNCPLGILCCVPQEKNLFFIRYNKSFINRACINNDKLVLLMYISL